MAAPQGERNRTLVAAAGHPGYGSISDEKGA